MLGITGSTPVEQLALALDSARRSSFWGSDSQWHGWVVISSPGASQTPCVMRSPSGYSRSSTGNQWPCYAIVPKKEALSKRVRIIADPFPSGPPPVESSEGYTPQNRPDIQNTPTIFEMPEVWVAAAAAGAALWWWRRRSGSLGAISDQQAGKALRKRYGEVVGRRLKDIVDFVDDVRRDDIRKKSEKIHNNCEEVAKLLSMLSMDLGVAIGRTDLGMQKRSMIEDALEVAAVRSLERCLR